MNAQYPRQRGVALLTALLVVAVSVILIAGMLDRGELTRARTRHLLRSEQAVAYTQGLEAWAARALLQDEGPTDTRDDIWSSPVPPIPVPGGIISGRMSDLSGCFNLNNLARGGLRQPAWQARYERLLAALGIDPAVAETTADWLDADLEPALHGAEDLAYLNNDPPYRTGNRSFIHVSELRLVRGVSAEVYARLLPHVCALPMGSKLNLNTASIPVWRSLAPDITEKLAERMFREGRANYANVGEIWNELLRQNIVMEPDNGDFAVKSQYFLARTDIRLDDLDLTYYSVIERGFAGIRVIGRSRGDF